ncbi:hypothetical protein V6N13_011617 [Hibiscus sabdariffa]
MSHMPCVIGFTFTFTLPSQEATPFSFKRDPVKTGTKEEARSLSLSLSCLCLCLSLSCACLFLPTAGCHLRSRPPTPKNLCQAAHIQLKD